MKAKLVKEHLNEYRDPYQNEISAANSIIQVFKEMGYPEAFASGLGANNFSIETGSRGADHEFKVTKNNDIYYNGTFERKFKRPIFLGNLNDLDEIASNLSNHLLAY